MYARLRVLSTPFGLLRTTVSPDTTLFTIPCESAMLLHDRRNKSGATEKHQRYAIMQVKRILISLPSRRK